MSNNLVLDSTAKALPASLHLSDNAGLGRCCNDPVLVAPDAAVHAAPQSTQLAAVAPGPPVQHSLTSAQVIEDTEQQLGSLPSQALPQWLGAYEQSPAKPLRPVAALRPDTAVTTSQEAQLADSPALVSRPPTARVQEPAPAQQAGRATRPEVPGSPAAPELVAGGGGLSRQMQQTTAQQELAHRQALAELMTQQDLDELSEAAEAEPPLGGAGSQGDGQHAATDLNGAAGPADAGVQPRSAANPVATDLEGAAGTADEGVQPGSAASPGSGCQEGQQHAAPAEVPQGGPGPGKEQVTPPAAAGAGTSSTPAAVLAISPGSQSLGTAVKTVRFSDKRKSGTK